MVGRVSGSGWEGPGSRLPGAGVRGSGSGLGNLQIFPRFVLEALQDGWPDAPDTLLGLFQWPVLYAEKLLSHPTMGRRRAEQIMEMGKLNMQLNEQFAGTGNGGVCAHQAYTALRQEAFRVLGTAAEEVGQSESESEAVVPSRSGAATVH